MKNVWSWPLFGIFSVVLRLRRSVGHVPPRSRSRRRGTRRAGSTPCTTCTPRCSRTGCCRRRSRSRPDSAHDVFSISPLPASTSENSTFVLGIELVDALHRTDVDARTILHVDAGFGDDRDTGHESGHASAWRRHRAPAFVSEGTRSLPHALPPPVSSQTPRERNDAPTTPGITPEITPGKLLPGSYHRVARVASAGVPSVSRVTGELLAGLMLGYCVMLCRRAGDRRDDRRPASSSRQDPTPPPNAKSRRSLWPRKASDPTGHS